MLRVIIPIVLLLAGVGGGVVAGLMFGAQPASDTAAADSPVGASEPTQTPANTGTEDTPASDGDAEFVRLNNQFVVPIVHHGSVRSLVVMALTLEVDPGMNERVFQLEPRLRDAFLRVMFAHANAGGFDGSFTEAAAMSPLRAALVEAAQQILGAGARDVLIVDITRQDA